MMMQSGGSYSRKEDMLKHSIAIRVCQRHRKNPFLLCWWRHGPRTNKQHTAYFKL